MTFFKDFVNVLSAASISFILLSSIFAFIVYFNLLGGRLTPCFADRLRSHLGLSGPTFNPLTKPSKPSRPFKAFCSKLFW